MAQTSTAQLNNVGTIKFGNYLPYDHVDVSYLSYDKKKKDINLQTFYDANYKSIDEIAN